MLSPALGPPPDALSIVGGLEHITAGPEKTSGEALSWKSRQQEGAPSRCDVRRRKAPGMDARGGGPPVGGTRDGYERDLRSSSLKSLGLPLPRLAFMHWPTR